MTATKTYLLEVVMHKQEEYLQQKVIKNEQKFKKHIRLNFPRLNFYRLKFTSNFFYRRKYYV